MFSIKKCIKLVALVGVLAGNPSLGNHPSFSVTVVDSADQSPIQYGSVSLVDVDRGKIITGGITDEMGHLTLSYSHRKPYNVKIEFIGYHPQLIEAMKFVDENNVSSDVNLGTIYLSQKALQYDEIEVSASRAPLHFSVDKKTYDVSRADAITGRAMKDFLKKIPSVEMNMNDEITINGDPNIRVLVNGVRLSSTHGKSQPILNLMNAGMIERVDVITNPSVEFDPDGMGGIINIVLKKNFEDSAHSMGSISAGPFHQYAALARIGVNNGKSSHALNLMANSTYEAQKSKRHYEWTYRNFTLNSIQEKSILATPITGGLGYDFQTTISDQHALSLFAGLTLFEHLSTDSILHTSPVVYEMTSNDHKRGWTADLIGVHVFTLNDKYKLLETEMSFSQSGEHQKDINDRISNGTGTDDHRHIYQDDATRTAKLNSIYYQKKSKFGPFSMGVQWNGKWINSELEYLHAPYGFNYDENILAGFFKLEGLKLFDGFFNLSGGIRHESTTTTSSIFDIELPESHQHADTNNVFVALIDSAKSTSPTIRTHNEFYPALKLVHKFPNHVGSLFLDMNRRINRPQLEMVHPFPTSMIDEYHVRTGNPRLKPEKVNMVRLGLKLRNPALMFLGFYYKSIDNLIQHHDVDFVTIGDQSFEVFTLDNTGQGHSFGKEFSVSKDFFSNKLIAQLYYHDWSTDATGAIDSELNSNTSGGSISGDLTVILPESFFISISGKYFSASTIPTGTIDPFWVVDVDLTKQLPLKNFTMVFSISDIFDSQKMKIKTNQSIVNPTSGAPYTQSLISERTQPARLFKIGLSYSFGGLSSFKPHRAQSLPEKKEEPLQIDY